MLKIVNNVIELIGATPIVKINRLTGPNDAKVYAKLEFYNPSGSVKDRTALYLIEYAEATGKLKKGKTILEASSGNMGIALAMIAAIKGYKIKIILPRSTSIEKIKTIKAYGAEVIFSPANKGTSGAIELKQKLLERNPEKYVKIDQYREPANILAHYQTTGREIIEQTTGKVDMIIVGIGTAGTGVGVSLYVKEYNPSIKIVGVVPKRGVSIEGLRNPKDFYPTKLFRKESIDEIVEITKEEIPKIFQVARKIARKEGLLIGMSAAAIMYVALKKAKELGKNKTIVTILSDNGMRYLSTGLFG